MKWDFKARETVSQEAARVVFIPLVGRSLSERENVLKSASGQKITVASVRAGVLLGIWDGPGRAERLGAGLRMRLWLLAV